MKEKDIKQILDIIDGDFSDYPDIKSRQGRDVFVEWKTELVNKIKSLKQKETEKWAVKNVVNCKI